MQRYLLSFILGWTVSILLFTALACAYLDRSDCHQLWLADQPIRVTVSLSPVPQWVRVYPGCS